jgi:phosphoribosylformylglycinamidine synthase II
LISSLFIRKTNPDPEADILLKRLRLEGFHHIQKLTIERVYRLEGIAAEAALSLKPVFCHPVYETASLHSVLQPQDGPIVEIGYQRAVTDPELPSILRAANALGVKELIWARIFHRYQFSGIDKAEAKEIAERHLYNPQVQVVLAEDEIWDTLRPHGHTGPVEKIELDGLTGKELLKLSNDRRLFFDEAQMRALQKISGSMCRPFTDAELEMFAQTWSDHCFHTTWKSLGLLQALSKATADIAHPLVLSAFEDNAGVMAFYDGWALTVKGETHNSPTAVSPYGGIMTKHGGVIRDTLGCGQGAWPIGGSTVMGLGDPAMSWDKVPKGVLHPKTILIQSIRGTADYTNPMGIPMMFPVYRFHPGYTAKCFALGHSIGLIPADRAAKGHPKPGDLAVLIGGLTGRDGLHGATVSSSSMTHETADMDAAHVQIGHPIEERKFMEAIPVLRDSGCVRAITDLGAAGLSSAAGEMGSDTGVWINLAWIPLKTEGLMPWEIWISESQERMLVAVPPEKLDEALRILERYEVRASLIGTFTNTKRCQVVYESSTAPDAKTLDDIRKNISSFGVDLKFTDLRTGCPLLKILPKKPIRKRDGYKPPAPKTEAEWATAVQNVLGHLNLCDQSAAGTQYDSTVQGITVAGPYGGKDGRMPNDVWISAPIRGRPFGVVASLAFSPFYGEVNPAGLVKLAMAEAITKCVAAGVNPFDIVLCDNFYTPRITPQIAWALKEMVDACCRLSRTFRTPFISGKDSSSGTFMGENGLVIEVPPTLCVFALGRMPDVRKLISKAFQKAGNALLLIGPLSSELGGSVYWNAIGGRGDRLPNPDESALMKTWKTLRELQENGDVVASSTIAEGGLVRRLFEMSIGSGLSCQVDLAPLVRVMKTDRPETALFAEMIGSVLIEVPLNRAEQIAKQTEAVPIGWIREEPILSIQTGSLELKLAVADLAVVWEKPFREVAL